MRVSKLFTKTSKTNPSDEVSKNAQLLTRAGFIYKEMAGVYAYTPLGLRVLEKIKAIVREEMNAIDGQELIMTNLQSHETWKPTKRWSEDIVDIWFKTSLQDGTPVGLAWSHEEPIVEMMKHFVSSYKDLPISVYQFQTKLRNELRAKSGILRGREFVMKDMYSLCVDEQQHDSYYDLVKQSYIKIFDRIGIGADTYVTFASGGAFTKFSHEFQTVCDAGEDIIYVHRAKNIAVNEEVLSEENLAGLGIKREELEKVKSCEVGNIFNFGTDKSEQMGFSFTNESGEQQFVHLGSYGIGITRLMGVVVERFADEKGMVWPKAIAPYRVYLATVGINQDVVTEADRLYDILKKNGIEVLYDDRDTRPGEKFTDADLIGIPYRVVVSEKMLANKTFELKERASDSVVILNEDQLVKKVS